MTVTPPPADMKLQRSSRDASTVPKLLEDWLSTILPEGADPVVTLHTGIDANGMSSETLILDVAWTEGGEQRLGEYVARVAPALADIPVFPTYALQEQFDTIRLVGELSGVPVPQVRWFEGTGSVLGTPFFLMDRIDGIVPQDVLPYTFGDNWLFDAPEADQHRLEHTSVKILADLHAIPDPTETFGFLDPAHAGHQGPDLLARNLARTRAWYEFAKADVGPSQLVERSLSWLEANIPDEASQGAPVLVWGDSRIGNMMYRDFEPVAVLDWEMAAIGPRQLDISWMFFAHQVFQSITNVMGMPGMPDFLTEENCLTKYQELTGIDLGDLTWYHIYNGAQWSIVFMRTGFRSIHFGEIAKPDDIEDVMHHKLLVEKFLDQVGA